MNEKEIRDVLDAIRDRNLSVEEALGKLKHLPYEEMAFAKIDHHRHLRVGVPEVIFASGKKAVHIAAIAKSMFENNGRVLITKATQEIFDSLQISGAVFHPHSGTISAGGEEARRGNIVVVTAGTSDIPVADEAAVTASFLGSSVKTIYDVGVAGLHRLMDNVEVMKESRVLIVVAGMEGALPSVIGGMTDKPLIAVPTSTGYGTSFSGLTALFAMLNSCVPGIAVMNIDNGFGAGCLAHKINCVDGLT